MDLADAATTAADKRFGQRLAKAHTLCVRLRGPFIQEAAPYMTSTGQQHWFGSGHQRKRGC